VRGGNKVPPRICNIKDGLPNLGSRTRMIRLSEIAIGGAPLVVKITPYEKHEGERKKKEGSRS